MIMLFLLLLIDCLVYFDQINKLCHFYELQHVSEHDATHTVDNILNRIMHSVVCNYHCYNC